MDLLQLRLITLIYLKISVNQIILKKYRLKKSIKNKVERIEI